MKRTSTRTVVLSKAMKYVDEDTRREFRDRRIQALECDNHVENDEGVNNEEEYDFSDVRSWLCSNYSDISILTLPFTIGSALIEYLE